MSEANEVPIKMSHTGCLDDIQAALKPLKIKSEKIGKNFGWIFLDQI